MYIVMRSDSTNGIEWVSVEPTEEAAIATAQQIEKTLEREDIVFVVPVVYSMQRL